jgi:type II secretory pathway pseudopilin PulG
LAKEEVKMTSLLRLLLKSQHQQKHSKPPQAEKGMTLIELLIGTVMAFLILTPMLAFVVDMLNTDRKEQIKANTEQDVQAAVDFIAQDLSQAIYIYDNAGVTDIKSQLPTASGTPILVFWKRKQLRNSLPMNPTVAAKPNTCDDVPPNLPRQCNDTYVRSLVAYYQIKDTDPTWCQPSVVNCPNRIVRYEISDGIDRLTDLSTRTPYGTANTKESQRTDPGFNISTDPNTSFNLNNPTVNVTTPGEFTPRSGNPQVLVNYIDHSQGPTPIDPQECQKALGNPTVTTGVTTTPILEATLRVPTPDNVNSFYACVDTARNLARVTIRGNSLRRLQPDATYDATRSAFFPTASVQVQGLGARGN